MPTYKDRAKLRFAGCPVHKPNVLIRKNGDDIINFEMDCKTAYPAMGYKTYIEIKTAHRNGTKWLEEALGITDYEVTDTEKSQ